MPSIQTITYLQDDGHLRDFPLLIEESLIIKSYKAMWTARLVDEQMITLQRQGQISFALSSLGEEAAAVGSAAALEMSDWLYPQYREVGVLFFRGFSIADYVHHMFGDALDLIQGRQMPNHFGSRALNIVTVSSPIGTKIPHAAGCGYAMKLQKENSVAVCYFGEGATSEGDFHAGVNFAAVRKTPTIFFCRNNGYAISTPVKDQFASDGVASKGIAYGIESSRVDGNDFFAVFAATKKAKELCLAGKGPVLIEAMTYRLGAHSTSDDPTRYRKEEEVAQSKEKCPLQRLRRYLDKKGIWSNQKESELINGIQEEIKEAIAKARKTPMPPLASLFEHVYFSMPRTLKEQLNDCTHFFEEHPDA